MAGDICFPGPSPLDTWRRLSQLKALVVQGVGDRALATIDPTELRPRDAHERRRLDRLIAVRNELGEPILRRLAKLPQILHQPLGAPGNLLLVHGSPLDPMEPITHDMAEEAVAHLLGDDPSTLVLCGGSHVPFDRVIRRNGPGLPEATRVINLGSVGEAPYGGRHDEPSQVAEGPNHGDARHGRRRNLDAPYYEARFAHATFIETSDGGIMVEQFVVPLGRAA